MSNHAEIQATFQSGLASQTKVYCRNKQNSHTSRLPWHPFQGDITLEVKEVEARSPSYLSAYRRLLRCEEGFGSDIKRQRHTRILGYLLLSVPPEQSTAIRTELCRFIDSCEDNMAISELGEFFEVYLIAWLYKYEGRTTATRSHHSRSSFYFDREEIKADITRAPKNYSHAKASALERDRWRCVVTGVLHINAPRSIKDGLDMQQEDEASTQCAHIIPQSTFLDVEHEGCKRDHGTSVLNVLSHFGYHPERFHGEKVHSLSNVMTLVPEVHDAFDTLRLCFEATPVENRYRIKYFDQGGRLRGMRELAEFSTTDPVNLPVPSSGLLSLHAMCCKVAHLSGAAEYITQVYRDGDGIGILAMDGSAELLYLKLASASIAES